MERGQRVQESDGEQLTIKGMSLELPETCLNYRQLKLAGSLELV
jgi:hypothetical protein